MMATLQRWDAYGWGQAKVYWAGKDAFMVRVDNGPHYGPWATRKQAEAWLREKRQEA